MNRRSQLSEKNFYQSKKWLETSLWMLLDTFLGHISLFDIMGDKLLSHILLDKDLFEYQSLDLHFPQ